ncbi:MAG: AAA family ATPase, partial [Chloroflexota bacterium]|nr:AAA family ATPase [Chloroflexota bacterium]
MKVLSVDLHGFKSFAQSTRLEFDDGVAGIVGPNGSGKSNVVEAVRWVLGEQSYSQLRGKRTEDVIWSGTKGRPPAGMAEVSITFDNADRFLPIEYTEVTITRRAYRSGENEYLINRSRVRLRDIIALVSAMGQGYTVVSQGTADAALSLTPENRRSLFEEAADITQHYARRDETLRRFTEMQANATRVGDLLAELAPRLRVLARQALQAREREAEEQALRDLQLAYFSRELARSQRARNTARQDLAIAEQGVHNLRAQSGARSHREEVLRQSLRTAEAQLARMDAERTGLSRDADSCERAVREFESKAAEAARELAGATSRHEAATTAAEAARRELAAAASAVEHVSGQVTSAQQELAVAEQGEAKRSSERDVALARLSQLRADVTRHEEDARQARTSITHLAERLDAAEAEHRSQASDLEERRNALARSTRNHQVFDAAARSAQQAVVCAAAAAEHARDAVRRCADEHARLNAEHVKARAEVREKQRRLSLLAEMQHTGTGLNRGAQAVLRASANQELRGIVGTLGSVMVVPERLEQAVESVLGAALQNVVTRRWADAEQAIALLKRTSAGRVTFLPLDTLRPPTRPGIPPGEGIIGIASDLVDTDAAVRPALLHALGRVLIVEDLPTARLIVQRMGGVSAVVTLGGETLRPGGSLTGGAPVRETGMLAREREFRLLPAEIERAERKLQEAEQSLRTAEQGKTAVADRDRRAQHDHQAAIHAAREAASRLEGVLREQERLRQQEAWLDTNVDRAATESETLRSRLNIAQEQQRTCEKQARLAARTLEQAEQTAGATEQESRSAAALLAALRTKLAVSQERQRSAQSVRTKAEASLRGAEAER